jgi:hypothetical protein
MSDIESVILPKRPEGKYGGFKVDKKGQSPPALVEQLNLEEIFF